MTKPSQDDILVLNDPAFCRENVCIVTGATSGIGQAVAVAAAVNGLTVLGLGRNEAGGAETVRQAESLGGRVLYRKTNLESDADIDAAVDHAASLGAIRYVANVAGLQHVEGIESFPMETYDRMHRIMQRAPLYLAKLTIPHMRQGKDGYGVIGNMGSIHSQIATIGKPAYTMVKFAMRALSQAISAEGEGCIRSFSVTTPYVKTPLVTKQIPNQARERGITPEEVVRDVMMGRARVKEMMTPIEAANLFIFGFSRHARFLVGGDLPFDGGIVLTY